jgi:CubicO group peptidase (beta-lactamase class C family)
MGVRPSGRNKLPILLFATVIVALAAFWWRTPGPKSETSSPPIATTSSESRIDSIVDHAMKSWRAPGAVIGIVHHDRIIYLKGHGVRQAGKSDPLTPDTVFPLASCTKAFTTLALAMLVDQGKMHWQDPVRKYVPYFHLADPIADADARIEDLITHRIGLARNDYLWYRSPWDRREVIRRIALVPPAHPFRTAFEYQTTMFVVAGCAVEAASGTAWQTFVQDRIVGPLGMKNVSYLPPQSPGPNYAIPHREDATGVIQVIPWYPMKEPDPAGSMNASARDLCQWLRFHLGDGTFDGKRLVSKENFDALHQPHMVIPKTGIAYWMNPETIQLGYGYGWVVQDYHGHREISHAGYIDGFRAHLTMLPDDGLGIVLFNNLDGTKMNLALSNSLVDEILGFPHRDWDTEIARNYESMTGPQLVSYVSVSSETLHGLAGTYENKAYGPATITVRRNMLQWDWNAFHGPLRPTKVESGRIEFQLENEWMHNPSATFSADQSAKTITVYIGGPVNVPFVRHENNPR